MRINFWQIFLCVHVDEIFIRKFAHNLHEPHVPASAWPSIFIIPKQVVLKIRRKALIFFGIGGWDSAIFYISFLLCIWIRRRRKKFTYVFKWEQNKKLFFLLVFLEPFPNPNLKNSSQRGSSNCMQGCHPSVMLCNKKEYCCLPTRALPEGS